MCLPFSRTMMEQSWTDSRRKMQTKTENSLGRGLGWMGEAWKDDMELVEQRGSWARDKRECPQRDNWETVSVFFLSNKNLILCEIIFLLVQSGFRLAISKSNDAVFGCHFAKWGIWTQHVPKLTESQNLAAVHWLSRKTNYSWKTFIFFRNHDLLLF